MAIKNIHDLEISDMASMAERRIIDTINLLDAILHEAKPQNRDADADVATISNLCDIIANAYDRAKSALNELQNN